MNTDEITSMIVASAEPKPMRLASPMMLLKTSAEISSSPLRPRLMTHTRSNARNDSMTVITRMTMLTGRITGKITLKNVFTSFAPSMAAASRSVGSTLFNPAR